MKKHTIMFSEQGKGWEMISIPSALQEEPYDELIAWAAVEARSRNLKGFLVSENPCPFPMMKEG